MRGKKRLCGLLVFMLLAMARPVPAQEAEKPPCTPVVRVFEKVICREEVATEQAHLEAIRQQYEDQGLDSDEALKTRSLERLRDIIWTTALERKFGAAALEPRAEEVELFSKTFRESLARSHEENLKTAARVEELLASGAYSEDQQRKMRSLLASVKTSIAFYNERESYKENMPPEFHDMVAEAERGLAETMMRNWKINKALYEEYGGRLAIREGAVEPVDAMDKFLGYIRETGKLAIIDPEFKDVFREMELFIAGPHDPLPEGSDYSEYYSAPEWQFNNLPRPAALETLKN